MNIVRPGMEEQYPTALAQCVDDRFTTGLDAAQVVRSAAHAAECPMAVFFQRGEQHFETCASFGIDPALVPISLDQALREAAEASPNGLLIINDITCEPGCKVRGSDLTGAGLSPVRFVAAAVAYDDAGTMAGLLVVLDTAAHAGLSGAKTYVLRTHAAQLIALLQLKVLQSSSSSDAADGRSSNTERLRLLESVVVNAHDAVLITEAEPVSLPGPRIVYCNASFTRTTGYSEAEVIGRTPRILQSDGTDRTTLDKLRKALENWQPVEVELLNRKKDGEEFWVELSIVPVADEKGWFTHWVSVQRDVSHRKLAEESATKVRIAEAEKLALEAEIRERKSVEAELLYTAFHDELTKLRNRAFFMDQLSAALKRGKRDPAFQFAVLFIDLDRFKLVNDSLGHRAGDLLLMEIAQRLRICTRPQDTVARVGGDEFAILVEDVEDFSNVVTLSKRIIETMRRPLWLGKQEVFPSCTVGVVKATEYHFLPEELLRDADIAMYEAKRNDKGNYAIFAASMHDSAVDALQVRVDLRNAISRDEFFVEYQPICCGESKMITGLEALIRWRHPRRGIVPPVEFISVAEETGLIRGIGQWVLRTACSQMRDWLDQHPGLNLRLNVNASGIELKDNDFTRGIQDVLAETGLDPRMLQLEVTESIFLQNPAVVGTILSSIRQLGVRIALDDFGMGYSSLSYLDQYQMDTIKIDQSFVACMLTRRRTMAIVETIVKLGRALDLDVVAEGVENEGQLRELVATGCRSVQGYYLGAPMSVADTSKALLDQSMALHAGGEAMRVQAAL